MNKSSNTQFNKNKKWQIYFAIVFALVGVSLTNSSNNVLAQGQNNSSSVIVEQNPLLRGLEVSPFLLDLDVPKGGNLRSQVDIVNRSTATIVITVTPRDFLPGLEGQPKFIPDPVINDPTFSLASWVELQGPTQFTIQPGELKNILFNLKPPSNAEQGTHYGALLFSYASPGTGSNMTETQQSVGTIILVRYGEARENGTIELTPSHHFIFNPTRVTFLNLFKNTGNVHVQPKGEVYIKNMWGEIVDTPFINRDAANVLPKTDRSFVQTWYPSSLAFGRYTVESVVSYGRGRLEARDKHHIWVLPWYLLLILGIIITIILWFIFHGRHWHKRRVIRKHLEKQNF